MDAADGRGGGDVGRGARGHAYVAEHRTAGGPFDVVAGGLTTPEVAADVVGPLAAAGATWWDERGLYESADLYSLAPVLRRVEAGPPRL